MKMGAKKLKKRQSALQEYGGALGSKIAYKLSNAVGGAIVFILGYILFIAEIEPSVQKFFLIFLWSIIGGFIVSMFFRIKYRYFDMDLDIQFLIRRIIIALFTTIYIYIGLSTQLFGNDISIYEVETLQEFVLLFTNLDFYRFLGFLALFKMLVFVVADLYADKIAFGG